MKARPAMAPQWLAALLWLLVLAFALRVAAQALQFWLPQDFLPAFSEFQGSNLPYWVLLCAQLLILAIMLRACWRMQNNTLVPHAQTGLILMWFSAIYMAGSMARIMIGLGMPDAPGWFRAWISAIFHVVLAGFMLALAFYHRRGARQ